MRTRTGQLLPLTLLLPAMAFLAVLVVIPMVQALLLSVATEDGGFSLENFQRMLSDASFGEAWRNTFLLLLLIVPLQVALALAIALLVNSRFRGHRFFFLVYTVPLAVSDLAAGLLWLAAFTERGFLNSALQGAGVISRPVLWLSFDNLAGLVTAIVIAESWRTTAMVLLILVAGLELIPRNYLETAELFGASRIRRTVHVVIPLLRPSLQSALIIRTIFAFQTFAVVFALAGRNLPVLAGEAYTHYATNQDEHLAAAYVVVILGLSLIAAVVYLRLLGPREAELQR
ncbi:MAG TPA: sugar ABC transporter permease [Candidatus Polarisedimenticolia bacterium]|nr:sugar ABC transporter permease [Candidatus Polarisedimenticolia bacterium]